MVFWLTKTSRDTTDFKDVADGRLSLLPTTERHFVELAKKDGYNAYFQDLFASPTRSEVCPHQKWEGWFAALGAVGTSKGKVPEDATAGVLRLLKYDSRAQLEALVKLAREDQEFDEWALPLEAMRRQKRSGLPPWRGGGGFLGRVLGEEHMDTLDSLNNMGVLLQLMKDYEGALGYYRHANPKYLEKRGVLLPRKRRQPSQRENILPSSLF